MTSSDVIVKKSEIEEDFLRYLDWHYRYDNSEEIEKVIKICDESSDFKQAWTDYEEQESVWLFLDKFALDLRSMLVAIVLERREEEDERAKEQLDRINDLRGLHG